MTAEQSFDEYHQAVYRFVYRLTGRADIAEDITQDCFLALLRAPQRWDAGRGGMKTYLFSMARNLTFKRYRDDHTAARVDRDGESIPDSLRDPDLSMMIAQLVAQLPQLQREALILFEYEGFQLSEIAQVIDADVGAVKSRLHRARENLKQLLTPYRKVRTHETV